MFVNKNYLKYKYLVSVGDNYVVLTNQRSVNADWSHPETIDVVYQYLYPSIYTLESEMTVTSSNSFTEIDISDDYYERADAPFIILATFTVIFFILFILNGLTRFVRKGGVFFGN